MVDDREIILTLKELDAMLADPRLSAEQEAELLEMRIELEGLTNDDTDPRLLSPAWGAMS